MMEWINTYFTVASGLFLLFVSAYFLSLTWGWGVVYSPGGTMDWLRRFLFETSRKIRYISRYLSYGLLLFFLVSFLMWLCSLEVLKSYLTSWWLLVPLAFIAWISFGYAKPKRGEYRRFGWFAPFESSGIYYAHYYGRKDYAVITFAFWVTVFIIACMLELYTHFDYDRTHRFLVANGYAILFASLFIGLILFISSVDAYEPYKRWIGRICCIFSLVFGPSLAIYRAAFFQTDTFKEMVNQTPVREVYLHEGSRHCGKGSTCHYILYTAVTDGGNWTLSSDAVVNGMSCEVLQYEIYKKTTERSTGKEIDRDYNDFRQTVLTVSEGCLKFRN